MKNPSELWRSSGSKLPHEYLVGTGGEWTTPAPPTDITLLLRAWGAGDARAVDQLMPLVYSELHRRAQTYLIRERPDHTLQPTALVHEAYLRLIGMGPVTFQDRAHFFALSAQVMRRILVDWARSRRSSKRGGMAPMLDLNEALTRPSAKSMDLAALDDSLKALESVDMRKSQVVEMRFFGGLTVEETAEALAVSTDTIIRDWRLAKSWLRRHMNQGLSHES